MNTLKKTLYVFALALALLAPVAVSPVYAQAPTATTTSTTLSQNVGLTDQVIYVASATGISAPGTLNQPVTALFIDQEYMTVTSVSGTQIGVQRSAGLNKAHASGAVVWIGAPANFRQHIESGYCNSTSQLGLPAIVTGIAGQSGSPAGDQYQCYSVGPLANSWVRSGSGAPFQLNDTEFFVPASNCQEHASANAGAGDGTYIIDGSVPALKGILSASGAGSLVFTCTFTVPAMRTTAGKGFQISSIAYNYSVQTLTATSMTASTLKTFTAPAASTSETASSATLVTAGGSLTQVPVVGSANLTAVSAGQYYTELVKLGTPVLVNNDQQVFVFTFAIAQSAASAMTVTSPGIWIYGYSVPL